MTTPGAAGASPELSVSTGLTVGPGGESFDDGIRAALAAARAEADRTADRLRLLSDVSSLLAATLDQGLGVTDLARLVVPQLADWCIVTVAAADGLTRDLGWAHRNPDENDALGAYARQQYAGMSEEAAVMVVLRTGEPVIAREMPADLLDTWVPDPTARAALDGLTPGSVAVLPLRSGEHTLGAMALVRLRDQAPLDEQDLIVAHEVARRAGVALDNARLYGEQRHLAETLQRSLLTDPPVSQYLDIAVRYTPAAAEAQVGGDWYDAFALADGAMVLVIGDVVGHDSRAAAAMGQLRGLLRGIGYTTNAAPATLLRRLDEAIDGLGVGTTATSVVARVDPSPDVSDGTVRVSWSNAGHPPGMLVSNGSVSVLENDDADLLLGIHPAVGRQESSIRLGPGDTLLLYTDGLVERRGVLLDDGISQLRTALAELAAEPLDSLCDRLIERMLPPAAADDVAMVAVRLKHP